MEIFSVLRLENIIKCYLIENVRSAQNGFGWKSKKLDLDLLISQTKRNFDRFSATFWSVNFMKTDWFFSIEK